MIEDTKNAAGSVDLVEVENKDAVVELVEGEGLKKASTDSDAGELLTEEQIEQVKQRMFEDMTKKIPVVPLSSTLHSHLAAAVAQLEELKAEINEKRQGTLERKDIIRGKLDHLKASGYVNIDELEFERTDVSVQHYVELLERMIEEVSADEEFYLSLLSSNLPSEMTIFKENNMTFEQVIEKRIQAIKRYVKNARRDLSISFSRYCFGFDNQIRQILYVEQVLQDAQFRK